MSYVIKEVETGFYAGGRTRDTAYWSSDLQKARVYPRASDATRSLQELFLAESKWDRPVVPEDGLFEIVEVRLTEVGKS